MATLDIRQSLGTCTFFSLPQLEKKGFGAISRLPFSIRVLLESVIRNIDGKRIRLDDAEALARWSPSAPREKEVPFAVGRVLLQDFTGVPLLVDLAAMRSAVKRRGKDPALVQPMVPLDLVVDHSVQVDFFGTEAALEQNMALEIERNQERYRFLKWGAQAFHGLRIVPPGFGICHQVNLEFLAKGVLERGGVLYPDTVVGTDSHTTMINGLGVVGWGVGGIEAEAAMLGEPMSLLTPDVVGFHMFGRLRPGVLATDLVLLVTQMLRAAKVVGKFVEYFGEGAASLTVPDRATVANMAPEYGATMGLFPVDEACCRYLGDTGRAGEEVERVRDYYKAQGMFGMPAKGQCDYSQVLELDLGSVQPSVSGPRRPQDQIELGKLKAKFAELLARTDAAGYGKSGAELDQRVRAEIGTNSAVRLGGGDQEREVVSIGGKRDTSTLTEREMVDNRPTPDPLGKDDHAAATVDLAHGRVVIAAITSCTNTSNPAAMLAAGLLAKKAVARGLRVPAWVKTSLAPGSRAVREYLARTGLEAELDQLGFNIVGYGCTTCIGNSGPLDPDLERAVVDNDLIVASVLSGNRNFEARIHQSVKANFLMSPPLVVAFALAGRVDIDLWNEPLAEDVFLKDLWPTAEEIGALLSEAFDRDVYRRIYGAFATQNPAWNEISSDTGLLYSWDERSTYIKEPPYFGADLAAQPIDDLVGARALGVFGDSVTTDHISPAGAIKPQSPAGRFLRERGVAPIDFNSYGARRGNDDVMVRGTFANVRIRNLMVPGVEGGVTVHQPSGEQMSIFDAALRYKADGVPLVAIAGREYGTGSSRDWAAKGTRLLGVRAIVASSFERIHRSNLIGMGVLPCELPPEVDREKLAVDGSEIFDVLGLRSGIAPRQKATLRIHRAGGATQDVPLVLRIDTPIEVEYFRAGGVLPYVLQGLLARAR